MVLDQEPAGTELEENDDFTAVFEEDSDNNLELWGALAGPLVSLPKRGDLVVYFAQGHLEYAASITSSSSTEVPTFGLQPQIICRVQHVQLIVNKKNDEACAHVTLLPELELVGVKPKGKEIEESVMDEAKDGGSPTKSASHVFSKVLSSSIFSKHDDLRTLNHIPVEAVDSVFYLDNELHGSREEIVAQDLQGTKWIFELKFDVRSSCYQLSKGWNEFVSSKRLGLNDKVVFVRYDDRKLTLGIKRSGLECGVPDSIIAKHCQCSNVLSPVVDAILNKSKFHVFYCPGLFSSKIKSLSGRTKNQIGKVGRSNFLVPYQKYMESITRPGIVGAEVTFVSSSFPSGVVTGVSEIDPFKWPNSKWKCLMVNWKEVSFEKDDEQAVSPWEILIPTNDPGMEKQTISHRFLQRPEFTSKLIPNIRTQAPAPQNPFSLAITSDELHRSLRLATLKSLEDLEIDRCSSFESKSTAMSTHLKISKRPDQEIPLDPMVHNSLEYLEFDSCLFHSPTRLRFFPTNLKEFKITNCVDSENVLILLDQKGLLLESLEVDGCSSIVSLPIDKLDNLRRLKISNCMNLKSLGESLNIQKHDSIAFDPVGGSNSPIMVLTRTPALRKLVISDCGELEFLPEGLHNLINLELLAIINCSSLVTFPEGGLPKNCLTSLIIYECENLKSLPSQLQNITSLQNLSVCGCPCLTSFAEGGLPPNLVSLRIIDCENFIHLSHLGIHKLKHLRRCCFSAGNLNQNSKHQLSHGTRFSG